MKQVTQTLRTGKINIADVPVPALQDSFILVRNIASIISAGTEKTKIDMGNKNLLQKAQARPDLVKQVINKLRTEGFSKTLQTVNTRLNAPSPLGYSSAGEVLAVGGLVEGIKPGDRVACGGAGYANHAELVSVPSNLVVKIPDGVSDDEAAFTTLGSIALQGVRLAEPKLGETFLVLGLGLLGQITVQLLRANGCHVLGTDLDPKLIKLAEQFGATGLKPGAELVNVCKELTAGYGVDGVLVCAGTNSNQPIEQCGEVTREKGRVVVVGAVRMDIPREEYFKKEISVVISRSYGPGRYDPVYEEGGRDYPLGYVRFTEQRNMQTFLELIAQNRLDLQTLITHRFNLEQAFEAYGLIEGKKEEPYLGIVLSYSGKDIVEKQCSVITIKPTNVEKSKLGLSFFGAGNYATATLLPLLKKESSVSLFGLVTASGRTAQGVAEQFGFSFCTSNYSDILRDETDAVMITTRHDTHASAVASALKSGKHVYVEKPLGLNVDELVEIHKSYEQAGNKQLMIGFNRRFSPLTRIVQDHFANVKSPLVINIRSNAGAIPMDHWIQAPNVGGGRMIGEGCHFVDLASALAGSLPVSVYSIASGKPGKSIILNDNLVVTLSFANGSIATITYTADGSKSMNKEYIEVFGGGRSATIHDFKQATLYSGDLNIKHKKLKTQDKGQKDMLQSWLGGLKSGICCISYESLMANSIATILAVESMRINQPLNVDLNILKNLNNS